MSSGRWKTTLRASAAIEKYTPTLARLALVASLASLVGGCGSYQVAQNAWNYNSTWDGFVAKHRNGGLATRAWHSRKAGFCKEKHLREFSDGFRDGYMSVADGDDGCTPPFAPREYWGWEYQSGVGQQRVASYFSGYPHGCRAAEEDGIGNWSQIQTGYGIQKEYAQAGRLAENQAPGIYPMPEATPPGKAALRKNSVLKTDAANAESIEAEAVESTQVPLELYDESELPIDSLNVPPVLPLPGGSNGDGFSFPVPSLTAPIQVPTPMPKMGTGLQHSSALPQNNAVRR